MSDDFVNETLNSMASEYEGLVPPEGDERVGKALFKILAEILKKKDQAGLPAKWNRNYELSRNRHWKNPNPALPLVSANLLFAHRQRTVNLLTDNNPTFDVTRVGMTEDNMAYDVLVKACEYWWNETEQQNILEKSILNGETYGCTIEKASYYPGEITVTEDGEYVLLNFGGEVGGEVEISVVDPFYFGFYPFDIDDIQKAAIVVHYRPMPLWEARLRWPHLKDKIRPDEEWIKEIEDSRKEVIEGRPLKNNYLVSIANVVKSLTGVAPDVVDRKEKQVLVAEFWVKDYTTDPQTKKAKYPGCIRCVIACNGGELVLEDKPNPSINPLLVEEGLAQKTYLWDKFPFAMVPSITDTTDLWGVSDFEQLEQLQIEVNKTISQLNYYKDKAARLKVINPKTSGVSKEEFTNRAGVIEPVNEMVAQAIRYLDPPPFPNDIANVLSIYKDLFATVAGQFELEQARAEGREVIAYKAIAALIERAATMMRGKIRNYSRLIRQRGRMYVALAQNWYTEERLIPIEYEGETITKGITGKDLILPGRITVVTGSTMPVSRVQQREEALELFNRGGCDAEEVLKRLGWSNYKEILKRMRLGPLNELKSKMEMLDVWPQVLEWIDTIEQTKPKELKRLIQQGEVLSFPALIFQLLESNQAQIQQAMLEDQGKTELAKAQAMLAMQKAQLVQEQINTEKIKQYMLLAGVEFDEQKLKVDKAKVVHEMETGQLVSRPPLETRKEPGRGVRGLKSDNRNLY